MPTDISQLPFLLRLIDDDSPRVRERVIEQLRAILDLGEQVRVLERAGEIALSGAQQKVLDALLFDIARRDNTQRVHSWLDWRDEPDATRRLEIALGALAQWQREADNEYSIRDFHLLGIPGNGSSLDASARDIHARDVHALLSQKLDELCEDFRATGKPWHPEYLSAWLFVERGLSGDTLDYYDPRNSNLLDVIEGRRGNPISLTCVFVLVGARLGIDIRGCNFPGHFLAHARSGNQDLLFDCFDSGRLLSPQETNAIRKAEPHLLRAPASPEDIIARVLRNLSVAYEHSGDFAKARFVRELLQHLETTT